MKQQELPMVDTEANDIRYVLANFGPKSASEIAKSIGVDVKWVRKVVREHDKSRGAR